MYGGHIIDDFDRLMCGTYLEHFMKDAVLDEMDLFPFTEGNKGGEGSGHDMGGANDVDVISIGDDPAFVTYEPRQPA